MLLTFAVIAVEIPELFMVVTLTFMINCHTIDLAGGQCNQIHLENRKPGDK
jgi:hypothetical protein